ncbi:phosphoglucosamine mutase [Gammaproteobacteria bacterium]|nr:phosphoglucosamine mutase [Gammaproteobacteria bacterium]MDC3279994.1 phosphoglucosamine mutase [Gammaproteobacteria bacterium]
MTKSAKKYFGTDGVRGEVGRSPVTPTEVLQLGWAAGRVLGAGHARGRVIIGKDTRISGYLLESALEAGLSAAGVDIALTGPLPTPGIAHLTRQVGACAGVVISASHNPYHDNGIKFFSAEGRKLNDETENAIEVLMGQSMVTVGAEALGKAERLIDAVPRYAEHCRNTLPPSFRLDGLKIAVDCANGAAYQVAPLVLRELGAEVCCIGVEPDGFNINRGVGSTYPERISALVRETHADIGIAFDGDADRVVLADSSGSLVNGDGILFLLSQYLKKREGFGGVVGTLMTNLGVEIACKAGGIEFVRAKVGDRHVLEELVSRNWILGGETSGHILCLDRSTTGDGLVAALAVLEVIQTTQNPLSELVSGLTIYPQQLINVQLDEVMPGDIVNHPAVIDQVRASEQSLGDRGRVVLRPSGTEPVVRVMVEGVDAKLVDHHAKSIADVISTLTL